MRRCLIVAAGVCILSSCRHSASQTPPLLGGQDQAGCPAVAQRARMRFAVNGVSLSVPVVEAAVAGERTQAVVDTGAESHVIAGWLARKLGLQIVESARTTRDGAGRALKISVVEDVGLEVEGLGQIPRRPTMVIDVPKLESLGIGLVISPQHMVEDGQAAVLDMPHRVLWREREECAFSEQRLPGLALPSMRACTDPSVATGYIHYLMPAAINGTQATLLLDTGSAVSFLKSSSPLCARLLERSNLLERHSAGVNEGHAAGGTQACRELPSSEIKIGGVTASTKIEVCENHEQDPVCPSDGVLGMPVLRACILAISPTRAMGACR